MAAAMQNAESSATTDGSTEGGRGRFNITQAPLTEDMVQTVAKQKNILDYNIIVSTSAMAGSFDPVQTSTSSSTSSSSSTQQRENPNGNAQITANFTMPDVTITGLRSSELYSDFSSGSSILASGVHITEKDNGTNVAIISQTLADANSLKVGNTIDISASDGTTTRTLKIIGIFTSSSDSVTKSTTGNFGNFNTAFSSPYNTIYTDYATALTLKSDATAAGVTSMGTSQAPAISSAVFYLDDPTNVDTAKADIAKMTTIDWTKFTISSDDTTYDSMVGAITKVASFASIVVIVVAIIGALILALILLLNVKERMFETGVLLSMGESRFKLVMQYAAEMLMIAVVAFSVLQSDQLHVCCRKCPDGYGNQPQQR